ncbi:MAG: hypothetical protein VKP62_00780 [Candidatus Sericytochromatia bacterium]|nr:hypothetical protein [Candidatus Sericytochromatia bacterium]
MRFEATPPARSGTWWVLACGVLLGVWLAGAERCLAQPAQDALLLDRVVATVEYDPVLLSTLKAYQRSFHGAASLEQALEALLGDRLLAREALRYGFAVSDQALTAEISRHPAPEGFGGAEWERLLEDRALARQFLTFRFGDFVPISREDIAAYLKGHPEAPGASLAAREQWARDRLAPIARAQRENAFREELRRRGYVRSFLTPPSGGSGLI